MSLTVRQLITQAYATAGVIPQGGTPTTAQTNEALVYFNAMVQSWMGFGIDTFARTSLTFDLVADQSVYTMGVGGDIETPRPLRVLNAYRSLDGIDIPLNEYSKQEWYSLSNKTATATPTHFYNDQESPISNVYIWPVPDATTISGATDDMSITLDVMLPYVEASLDSVPELPVHWYEACIFNLAVRLCVRFGRDVPVRLDNLAFEALTLAKGNEYEEADIYRQPDRRF